MIVEFEWVSWGVVVLVAQNLGTESAKLGYNLQWAEPGYAVFGGH